MRRTLYIVRHAKAEDRAIFQQDHDRDLVPEGIMAAARMGAHLKHNGVTPDVIISSTANRARDTAKVIAEQLGYETERIVYNERLFDGGPKAYLAEVNEQPETYSSVMICRPQSRCFLLFGVFNPSGCRFDE